jgi:hypothetical protein
MSSLEKLAAGAVLVATASLGVLSPLDAKATPSPGEDWAYVADAEPCIPQVSVSDNVVDNTIRVQVRDNACQISREIYLYIQDDRPQPLRLKAVYHHHNSWVASIGDARPGRYRVMGLSPTPAGIGDYTYITSRELGIDQVITIGSVEMAQVSTQQLQSVAPPPQVVATPQRVVTTLDPELKRLIHELLDILKWFKEAFLRIQAALTQTS